MILFLIQDPSLHQRVMVVSDEVQSCHNQETALDCAGKYVRRLIFRGS